MTAAQPSHLKNEAASTHDPEAAPQYIEKHFLLHEARNPLDRFAPWNSSPLLQSLGQRLGRSQNMPVAMHELSNFSHAESIGTP